MRCPDQRAARDGVLHRSALKSAQIRTLISTGDLQLTLFDQTNLAEITSEEFSGERLVVCRNPQLATERARKRDALLTATEQELEKVKAIVEGPRGRPKHADGGRIGERVGRVANKYKIAKHFELQIATGAFHYQRKHEQIEAEAALDGIHILRTTCPADQLTTQAVVRVCKQLKMAERAYRTMKSALEVRPIHHHLEDRVRAHFFLCMLAYMSPSSSPATDADAVWTGIHRKLPNRRHAVAANAEPCRFARRKAAEHPCRRSRRMPWQG
jgi:hypothetical protein